MSDRWNFAQYLYSCVIDWEKPAYIFKERYVSYREVKRKAQGFANGLLDQGIRPKDRVLLVLNDTPSFPIAFLAALQIGAIPIPINPRSKISAIQHYISESSPAAVVGEKDVILKASAIDTAILGNIKFIVQDIYDCELARNYAEHNR